MTLAKAVVYSTLGLLVTILALGAFIRFYDIGEASVRGDEGAALMMSQNIFGQDMITADVHPPLFYALLKIISAFTSDIKIYRGIIALLSVLCIPVIYFIGKRTYGVKPALLASFIFAISQANTRYAQLVRPYALITLLTALSIYFLIAYMQDKKPWQLGAWAGFSILAFWTHYYFLPVFAVMALYLLLPESLDAYRTRHILVVAIVLVCILPLAGLFAQQVGTMQNVLKPMYTQGDPLMQPTWGLPVSNNIIVRAGMMLFHAVGGYNKFSLFLLVPLIVLVILFAKEEREPMFMKDYWPVTACAWNLLFLLIPVSVLFTMITGWATGVLPYHTYARYLLLTTPALFLFIAGVFFTYKGRRNVIYYAGVFLLVLTLLNFHAYNARELGREDFEGMTGSIGGNATIIVPGLYPPDVAYYKPDATICLPESGKNLSQATFLDLQRNEGLISDCKVMKCVGDAVEVWKIDKVNSDHTITGNCLYHGGYSLVDFWNAKAGDFVVTHWRREQ